MYRLAQLHTFPESFPRSLRAFGGFIAALLLLSVAATTLPAAQDPTVPELFRSGEAALRAGNLDQAESSFKQVLAKDPNSAGAFANLGVIAMRRQNWPAALDLLHKAERLAPNIAGIRLNIGLVYYRQNEFHSAIAPFESVVRDQPDSTQARYLLGLCYFFTDRDADAVRADIEEARRLGASGVPFFVIDRKYGISGAQPAETFLQALRTAYAGDAAAAR